MCEIAFDRKHCTYAWDNKNLISLKSRTNTVPYAAQLSCLLTSLIASEIFSEFDKNITLFNKEIESHPWLVPYEIPLGADVCVHTCICVCVWRVGGKFLSFLTQTLIFMSLAPGLFNLRCKDTQNYIQVKYKRLHVCVILYKDCRPHQIFERPCWPKKSLSTQIYGNLSLPFLGCFSNIQPLQIDLVYQ